LAKTRHHVIFGEGNINAGMLIIGEAPASIQLPHPVQI